MLREQAGAGARPQLGLTGEYRAQGERRGAAASLSKTQSFLRLDNHPSTTDGLIMKTLPLQRVFGVGRQC